jgi:hypothetical protein
VILVRWDFKNVRAYLWTDAALILNKVEPCFITAADKWSSIGVFKLEYLYCQRKGKACSSMLFETFPSRTLNLIRQTYDQRSVHDNSNDINFVNTFLLATCRDTPRNMGPLETCAPRLTLMDITVHGEFSKKISCRYHVIQMFHYVRKDSCSRSVNHANKNTVIKHLWWSKTILS